jgi:hypothetical protein
VREYVGLGVVQNALNGRSFWFLNQDAIAVLEEAIISTGGPTAVGPEWRHEGLPHLIFRRMTYLGGDSSTDFVIHRILD